MSPYMFTMLIHIMYKQLELCRHLYMFYFIEHMLGQLANSILGQSANILVLLTLWTVMFHCVYMHYYYIVPEPLPIDCRVYTLR